jgi:hypothetical protein
MRCYKARELANKAGKWHYTCEVNGDIHPVGHCSSWDSCSCVKNENRIDQNCEVCSGRGVIAKSDPCLGHDTPEEAELHYKEYLLDSMKKSNPKTEKWPKNKCHESKCEEEALYSIYLRNGGYFELCECHANKECVSSMLSVGECWES